MATNWGEGAKGAAGGAMTGAAVGSLGGPVGTAIGGVAGGLLGGAYGLFGGSGKPSVNRSNFDLPGYQQQYNQYGQIAGQSQGRQAPQAGFSDFRSGQQNLVGMLQAQARGKGPGQQLVRMQAQGMADRGSAQQLAMARGARPGAGPASYLGAAQNAAGIQSQVGGQAAQAGLQAQLGAIGQLQGTLEGARGADELQGRFNADAQMRQTGMNDQRQMEALRQRLMAAQMQQQGGMGYQNAKLGLAAMPSTGDKLLGMGMGAGQMAMTRGMMGGGGGGGGGQMPAGMSFSMPSAGGTYNPQQMGTQNPFGPNWHGTF